MITSMYPNFQTQRTSTKEMDSLTVRTLNSNSIYLKQLTLALMNANTTKSNKKIHFINSLDDFITFMFHINENKYKNISFVKQMDGILSFLYVVFTLQKECLLFCINKVSNQKFILLLLRINCKESFSFNPLIAFILIFYF